MIQDINKQVLLYLDYFFLNALAFKDLQLYARLSCYPDAEQAFNEAS